MKKEELILDIKDRFFLALEDFKELQPYELSLICETYPKLSGIYIYETIVEYRNGKITLPRYKRQNNSDRLFVEEMERGVFKGFVL